MQPSLECSFGSSSGPTHWTGAWSFHALCNCKMQMTGACFHVFLNSVSSRAETSTPQTNVACACKRKRVHENTGLHENSCVRSILLAALSHMGSASISLVPGRGRHANTCVAMLQPQVHSTHRTPCTDNHYHGRGHAAKCLLHRRCRTQPRLPTRSLARILRKTASGSSCAHDIKQGKTTGRSGPINSANGDTHLLR
jgi:hypothetical protein